MGEDLGARLVLAAVMAGLGVLLLFLARAGADGRLRRNMFVGIRIPSTMASDAAWRAGHRAGEAPLRWAGWAALGSSVGALLLADDRVAGPFVLAGCLVVLALVSWSGVLASRAARAVEANEPPRGAGPGTEA